ncbi:hypothetical protein E2P71_01100 [Candidatus Bathyarchaeota archaeon]|nr:hypothetical protein E2P71_01100 [Candidatus Bathyarchaeota archaeon]
MVPLYVSFCEAERALYHIKKLVESGYVYQADNKDYVLTTKGLRVLVMLAQLTHELEPEKS